MALGPVYGMGVGSGTGGGYLKITQEPVQAQILTYNGQNQSPTWNNFSTAQMTIVEDSGPKKDTGTYEVKIKPIRQYCWQDGTQKIKTFHWTIQPAAIVAPTLSVSSVVFNDGFVSPTITYDSQIATYGDNPDTVFTVENLSQKFVNTYIAKWTIKNNNYVWKTATPAVKTADWKITKRPIAKPLVSDLLRTYSGVEQGPTISPNTSDFWTKTDYKALDVGSHNLIISLKDPDNNTWANGDSDNLSFSWTMTARRLQKPTGSNLVFNYDSNTHGPSILNEPGDVYVKRTGPLSEVNAGTYQIVYSITHNNTATAINVVWDDGTSAGSTGNVIIEYVINPVQIPIPTASSTVKTYNTNVQSPGLSDMNNYVKWLDITGTPTATNAGNYTVTYAMKTAYNGQHKNIVWSDGTADKRTINWQIKVKELSKPEISTTSFVFQGSNINILNYEKFYDETFMTRLGDDTQQLNVGTYSLSYQLKGNTSSQTNVQWSDGTLTQVKLSWKITKKSLTIPKQSGSLTYNTSQQTVTWNSNYDEKFMTVTGTTGINAGSYTSTFTSKFPGNAQFGSSDTATSTWKINIKTITKPSLESSNFYYQNTTFGPVIQNEDLTFSKRTGTITAKNAGNYTIKYTLHKNTSSVINVKWADDSTGTVSLSWTINKIPASKPTLSATSVTLTNTVLTKTITVTRDGDGAITATSPDTSKLLVDIDDNEIKLTVNDQTDTSTPLKFKVGVAEGTNYKAVSTTNQVEVSVTISGFITKLAVASTDIKQVGHLFYKAANVTATFKNFDENYMTITGNVGKEVGSYIATITCKDKYSFSDGVTKVKVSWTIETFTVIDEVGKAIVSVGTGANDNNIDRTQQKFGTGCFHCNGKSGCMITIDLQDLLAKSKKDKSCQSFTLDFWAKTELDPSLYKTNKTITYSYLPIIYMSDLPIDNDSVSFTGFEATNSVTTDGAHYTLSNRTLFTKAWNHYIMMYDSLENHLTFYRTGDASNSQRRIVTFSGSDSTGNISISGNSGFISGLLSTGLRYIYINLRSVFIKSYQFAYIDELRLSKGLRWTDQDLPNNYNHLSDYKTPTEPYTVDEDTLLLLHFD